MKNFLHVSLLTITFTLGILSPVQAYANDAKKAPLAPAGKKADKAPKETVKKDIKVGTGATAAAGKMVTVHYTGKLTDGSKFDSSLDRGTPFTFPLGSGQVIQGWEKGVAGMKVGGKRHLTIPANEGYGDRGAPPVIPPGATLEFDVELLDVK